MFEPNSRPQLPFRPGKRLGALGAASGLNACVLTDAPFEATSASRDDRGNAREMPLLQRREFHCRRKPLGSGYASTQTDTVRPKPGLALTIFLPGGFIRFPLVISGTFYFHSDWWRTLINDEPPLILFSRLENAHHPISSMRRTATVAIKQAAAGGGA